MLSDLSLTVLLQNLYSCSVQIPLRVILGYHSVPQVLAGAALGAVSAASWFLLGQMAFLPFLKANIRGQIYLALVMAGAVTSYMVLAFRKKR